MQCKPKDIIGHVIGKTGWLMPGLSHVSKCVVLSPPLYSGGGLGWGPIRDFGANPPPHLPSPGVPGEGDREHAISPETLCRFQIHCYIQCGGMSDCPHGICSTPVRAIGRTVSKVTPPEASKSTLPFFPARLRISTASVIFGQSMLSKRITSQSTFKTSGVDPGFPLLFRSFVLAILPGFAESWEPKMRVNLLKPHRRCDCP